MQLNSTLNFVLLDKQHETIIDQHKSYFYAIFCKKKKKKIDVAANLTVHTDL